MAESLYSDNTAREDASSLMEIERMLAEIDRLRTRMHPDDEEREPLTKLQRQVDDLTRRLERLAFEVERLKENQRHEREMLPLRIEHALLQFEGRMRSAQRGPGSNRDES